MARSPLSLAATLAAVLLASCAERATLPASAGFGPNPELPPPRSSFLPTLSVPKAEPWRDGGGPIAAPGFAVQAFARGLEHPRWLHVLPNGDVLVAETNAPAQPEDKKGVRGWVMGLVKKRVGAAEPSPNRITLLRDEDGDGIAETRTRLLEGLNSPFGMALAGKYLYVAEADSLLRFDYRAGATRIDGEPKRLSDLPGGPRNHHWTKNVIANRDGSLLYVAVGSNSNVAENGMTEEERRAAILEIDAKSGRSRVFASGLRNPVGLAWNPVTRKLWTAVNERDELGSDLVPDYMTSVEDG